MAIMNKKVLIGLLAVLSCGLITWLIIGLTHKDTDVKPQEPKKEKVKKQESKKAITQSSSSTNQEINDEDINVIDEFFTTYQQYNSTSSKAVDRAKIMLNNSTEDVVNQLMPGALNDKPEQDYKFEVDYKFLQPIEVQPIANSDKYQVTLNYRVTVDNNHSDHKDVYIVTVDNKKITNVIEQSADYVE